MKTWLVVLLAIFSVALLILFISGLNPNSPTRELTLNADGSIALLGILEPIGSILSGVAAIITALKK